MTDHVREQIAVAAIAAVTSLTTTGANVFRDRDTQEQPLKTSEIPGLVVEDDGDPAETLTLGVTRLVERRMSVKFTAHVKATSGYSTQLNTILKEIEIALDNAVSLGGAKSADITDVGARESSLAGDQPAVRQTFTFEFFYITAHNAPDVAL